MIGYVQAPNQVVIFLLMNYISQYRGRAFKVRTPEQWVVVVTSEDMINDIKKASDNYLSFDLAVKDVSLPATYAITHHQY